MGVDGGVLMNVLWIFCGVELKLGVCVLLCMGNFVVVVGGCVFVVVGSVDFVDMVMVDMMLDLVWLMFCL